MQFDFEQFKAGYLTDGASRNAIGYGEFTNLDLDFGEGIVGLRPSVNTYSIKNGIYDRAKGLKSTSIPAVTGYFLEHVYQWSSGVRRQQINTLLVYRSTLARDTAANSGIYQWKIYSNAPALSRANAGTSDPYANGAHNDWTLLEPLSGDYLWAPSVRVKASGGALRIALGNHDWTSDYAINQNSNDYRILIDLCANGDRSYCTGTQTIKRTDAPDVSKPLGAGGHTYYGWLWDYGQLYHPWDSATRVVGVNPVPKAIDPFGGGDASIPVIYAALSNAASLDVAEYAILLAPIYDGSPDQVGVPFVYKTTKFPQKGDLKFLLRVIAGHYYSPRMVAIAVYVQRTDHPAGPMSDFLRVKTIDMNDLAAAGSNYDVLIDQTLFSGHVGEGSWAADTNTRPLMLESLTNYFTSPTLYQIAYSAAAWHDAEQEKITVKPVGFAQQKEWMFAWGVEGDPGQTEIRISTLASDRGMFDVWWKDDVAWKGGMSEPVTYLLEFDSRIVQFSANHVYEIEPADPLRSRDSYIEGSDSHAGGVPLAFVDTICVGHHAVYFANHKGVWAYRGGRIENIARGFWLGEWLALTDVKREASRACYCHARQEYWLQAAPGTVPHPVYVYRDDDVETRLWRVYKFANFRMQGAFRDENSQHVMYGTYGITAQRMVLFDDPDAGDKQDFWNDGPQSIDWALACRDFGQRTEDMIADVVDVKIERPSNHTVTLTMYGQRSAAAWETLTIVGSNTDERMQFSVLECNEFRWKLSGSYTGNAVPADVRPRLRMLSFGATRTLKMVR